MKEGFSLLRSYFILFLCVVLWAANYLTRQLLLTKFPPLFLSAFSLSVASIFFLSIILYTRAFQKVNKKELVLLVITGLIGLIANQIFLFTGLQYSTATNASLIFSLAPLLTALLSGIFLKEKITARLLIGSVIAIIGIYFVLSAKGSFVFNVGDILLFGATATFACNLIFVKLLSNRLSTLVITTYSFVIASVMFDPFIFIGIDIDWNQSFSFWMIAFLSVLIGQGVTNLAWNSSMHHIGAARSAIVLNLQPVITLLLDYWIFHSEITTMQLLGIFCVFIGVLYSSFQLNLGKRKFFSLSK